MSPTMFPLDVFLKSFPGSIIPPERCAVISAMIERRVVGIARLGFSQIATYQKNTDIVSGHHFCKKTEAGLILLESVLSLNHIHK